jgi:hypothetical protein
MDSGPSDLRLSLPTAKYEIVNLSLSITPEIMIAILGKEKAARSKTLERIGFSHFEGAHLHTRDLKPGSIVIDENGD